MTPETTLAELDRLAATEVMGWDLTSMKHGWINERTKKFTLIGGADWQPTRNIAQAWECLEKFDSVGCSISLINLRRGTWNCEIIDRDNYMVSIESETAPLAIVRACLAARGVGVSPTGEEGK